MRSCSRATPKAGARTASRARWRAVCADAKLGGLRLYDLRHTAASQAVMSGEGLPLVGRLLGHNRHRTTAGYAHLADAHLVEAAEMVGAIIATAMAMSTPTTANASTMAPQQLRVAEHVESVHQSGATVSPV